MVKTWDIVQKAVTIKLTTFLLLIFLPLPSFGLPTKLLTLLLPDSFRPNLLRAYKTRKFTDMAIEIRMARLNPPPKKKVLGFINKNRTLNRVLILNAQASNLLLDCWIYILTNLCLASKNGTKLFFKLLIKSG